jgi:hypothetical protein
MITCFRVLAGSTIALSIALAAQTADLAKFERVLVKEPAYQGTPRYCLLAFGPDAKTRVWLVQDGDTLYVDRNGNGDLTEAGERVSAKANKRRVPEEGVYDFEAGEIAEGSLVHRALRCSIIKIDYLGDTDENVKELLSEHPEARGYTVDCDIEIPGHTGAGIGGRVEQGTSFRDLTGLLQFAETPETAPVIHFGGPWQISLYERAQLVIGRQKQVTLAVGTPGVGPGSTALVAYEKLIPRDLHPKLEIVFPPGRAGSVPFRELYELKGRC